MLLTPNEVHELTGKARKSDQRVALTHMGIPYKIRPDGTPAVLRTAMEAWTAERSARHDNLVDQETEQPLEESLRHLNPLLLGTTGHALLGTEQIFEAAKPWEVIQGIYFLTKDDQIIYVGQSNNIMRRVGEHINKEFDSYSYIRCTHEALDLVESIYIFSYSPPLNYNKLLGRFITPMSLGTVLDIASVYTAKSTLPVKASNRVME